MIWCCLSLKHVFFFGRGGPEKLCKHLHFTVSRWKLINICPCKNSNYKYMIQISSRPFLRWPCFCLERDANAKYWMVLCNLSRCLIHVQICCLSSCGAKQNIQTCMYKICKFHGQNLLFSLQKRHLKHIFFKFLQLGTETCTTLNCAPREETAPEWWHSYFLHPIHGNNLPTFTSKF